MTLATPHQLVRASAGTGKTYQLSTRYLTLLHRGAPPETILATTFTRKAAGEVLSRIITRLANAAQDDQQANTLATDLAAKSLTRDDCRDMLAKLCRSLDAVNIATIDSFFHQAAQAFRLELDITAGVTIVDDANPLVTQLRLEAIEAVLADAAEQSDSGQAWKTLIDHLRQVNLGQAHRSVTEALHKLFTGELYETYRHHPEPNLWDQLTVPPGLLPLDQLTAHLNRMRDLSENFDQISTDKRFANAHQKSRQAAEQNDWRNFLTSGFAKNIVAGDYTYYKKDIPEPILDAYQPLLTHARAALIDRLAKQTRATHHLLAAFHHHFTRLRRAHGLMLYNDLAWRLAQHLPQDDPALLDELYFRLDHRVTHLLIDEFQDTSLQQWAVLSPIAQEVTAHSDHSRTFFCVGDVKQAIYGWRGGCADLMNQLPNDLHLSEDAIGQLKLSYRSAQTVLDTVNTIFQTLPANPCLQHDQEHTGSWSDQFPTHQASNTQLAGYVELITTPTPAPGSETDHTPADQDADGDADNSPPTSHELSAAKKIAQIHAAAPANTLGVLVLTNQHVKRYINLLQTLGVHASGEGGTPLASDPTVAYILSALTLADHPADSAAAFHAYNSPLGPILNLRGFQPKHTQPVSAAIRADLLRHGYAKIIFNWTRQLAPNCAPDNLDALDRLTQLADVFESASPTNTFSLRPVNFVDHVKATPVEEPNPSPVRVMTINKAKGLEFDAVALPQLDRHLTKNDRSVILTDRPHPTAAPTAIYRAVPNELLPLIPELEPARQQHQRATLHDAFSKLYVAITRPRQALYIIIPPITHTKAGKPGAPGWSSPSYAAILRRALSTVGDEEDPTGGQTLYTHGNPNWPGKATATTTMSPRPHDRQPTLPRAVSPTNSPIRLRPHVTPSALVAAGRLDPADLLSLRPDSARRRGTLFHAWFCTLDWLDPSHPSANLDTDYLLDTARRHDPQIDLADARNLIDEFTQMLTQPQVADTFSKPDSRSFDRIDLWKEHPFAVIDNARVIEGVFDRVHIAYKNGHPHHADLIDFKADRLQPHQIEEHAQRYAPQLKAYQNALAQLLALPTKDITAKLLFVTPGIEWILPPTTGRAQQSK